ncbi:CheW domain-containing protein [Teichococcus vastitatis]|uniref:CheW-like domain-containing protein n=1 Tax=Teichococcus vastitatis TaxID=2307076 RepID=A0ABS9W5Y8_9PROT|nr:hypothetical protein [Pseudoroseomonas vastitatis]MCI0754713.1 hypothetical protein [Pseudoroseomonas vastitatis]
MEGHGHQQRCQRQDQELREGREAAALEVGEVVPLRSEGFASNPPTLDTVWREVSQGVHRQDGQLLIVLDVDRILTIG